MCSTEVRFRDGRRCWPLLVLLLAATAAPAAGGDVGKVIAATGAFHAERDDGSQRTLRRQDPVREGDTLVTGPDARAQVRFDDGALVALKAGTRFRVSAYQTGASGGSAVLELLKGGLRTITGTIGRERPEEYRMETPVATIGIRGTHFGLHLCAADCPLLPEMAVPPADGLYGGVIAGGIEVSNDKGSLELDTDSYFYVSSRDRGPLRLLIPPAIVFDAATLGRASSRGTKRRLAQARAGVLTVGDKQSGSSIDRRLMRRERLRRLLRTAIDSYAAGEQTDPSGSLPLGATTPDGTAERAPSGSVTALAFIGANQNEAVAGRARGGQDYVLLGAGGALQDVPVLMVHEGDGRCGPCAFSNNEATLVHAESAVPGLTWGTWLDGHVVVDDRRITTTGPYHFLYVENPTRRAQLADLGYLGSAVTFSFVDGPALTDAFNNQYQMAPGSTVTVDFGGFAFTDMDLSASDGTTTWTAGFSGNLPLADGLRDGVPLAGGCSGGTCGVATPASGSFDGVFIGSQAGGYGGSLELDTVGDVNALSGVAVFQRP